MPMTSISAPKRAGFTLIELIITIIIMSFAAIIIIPYLAAITHGPDPVLREKAIALGQAMMDEILAKKWDENSPNGGSPPICTSESTSVLVRPSVDPACDFGTSASPLATVPGSLGLDGETANPNARMGWDDVDDYAYLNFAGGNFEQDNFWGQDGALSAFTMPGFSRWVEVDYIQAHLTTTINATSPASAASSTDSKRIVVTVQSPLGETYEFVAISCNF
ncbi:MAG: prepilin-type N-terminal cleavage/methylation domain-containing protein [Proteobacteria bacterium]|nr:prepilin-type N-terminal cleavage/methylation domain-containing protein [Pseudomonadota bacterium]MBU1640225.1 prepilin-type N-terminal cleavage/methylation domain-containing protein [Pseudomonadota bacterium]